MMHRYGAVLWCAIAFAQTPAPYHDPRSAPLQYPGPGRDDPPPADLTDVRIGYFGPDDITHPDGGLIRMGAELAMEQANRAGGYRGLPFRFVTAWADNPWKGGVSSLARVTYSEHLWAILGGIDGATTHLAEQVVAKALVTLVNPAATDRSIHTAGVPWMFSCVPGDDEQARVISEEVKRRGGEFAVLSATDHDSRALSAQLKSAFARDRLAPAAHAEFETRTTEGDRLARSVIDSGATTVIVLADARDSLSAITAIRRAGFTGAMVASASIARLPGEKSLAGVLYPEIGAIPTQFREAFLARYHREPDFTAAHAYDAMNIIITAVKRAGLNRIRIRDAVRAVAPYDGVTGRIEWDAFGQNRRSLKLRTY